MTYTAMRTLLEDAREELATAAEQGLARGGTEQAVRALENRFMQMGLEQGGRLLGALGGELGRARLDAHWSGGAAVRHYTELWRYLGICLRRLEYLEARARLQN